MLFGISRKSPAPHKKEEDKKPHIKKPLNAFMLYMKEMRAKVVAECTLKESAAINQILGRRVNLTHAGARLCTSVWQTFDICCVFVNSGIPCQERNKPNTTSWPGKKGNCTRSSTRDGQHETIMWVAASQARLELYSCAGRSCGLLWERPSR